jgi:hypothetical protein
MGRSATRLPPRWRAAPTRLRPPATTIASSHSSGHFRVRAPLPAPSAATALALPAARFNLNHLAWRLMWAEVRRVRESARHRSVVLDRRGQWMAIPPLARRGDLVQPVVPLTTSALPRATPPHHPSATRPALHRRCRCVEHSTSGQRKQAGDIYVGDDVTIRSANPAKKWSHYLYACVTQIA